MTTTAATIAKCADALERTANLYHDGTIAHAAFSTTQRGTWDDIIRLGLTAQVTDELRQRAGAIDSTPSVRSA